MVIASTAALLTVVRLALAFDPRQSLWAEDGAVFFQDAMRSPGKSLTAQYGGYAHLLPRMFAELGHVVRIDDWPLLVVVTCAVVMGLIGALVFSTALSLGIATPAAVIAALVPVLLPGFGDEVLGSWANLQWPLAYALAWVLIVPPERSDRAIAFLVGLLAVIDGLACAFICPLVFLHGRRWYRHPALPGMIVGALYQLVALVAPNMSLAMKRHSLSASTLKGMATGTGQALFDSGGGLLRSSVWKYVGMLCVVIIVVIVARSKQRRTGLALLVSAAVTLLAFSVANGSAASRYGGLAASLVVAALIVAIGPKAEFRGWHVWALAVLFIPVALSLPVSAYRSNSPSWAHGLEVARRQCANGAHAVRIPVGPFVDGHPWGSTNLACDSL